MPLQWGLAAINPRLSGPRCYRVAHAPTLPYPTLPYPTLPYPTLPCHVWGQRVVVQVDVRVEFNIAAALPCFSGERLARFPRPARYRESKSSGNRHKRAGWCGRVLRDTCEAFRVLPVASLLSSEATAQGTGLAVPAGKEDPAELDSSLTLV